MDLGSGKASGSPYGAVLIGCDGPAFEHLRREVDGLRARIVAEYPDVTDALARHRPSASGPCMFLVAPRSDEDVRMIERLNASFPGVPIRALIVAPHDPALFLKAMRAGAAQIVRAPLQSEDFRRAATRLAVQFGHVPARSEILAIAGVKPGGGATTIAINAGDEIGRLAARPSLLIEMPRGAGRLATYLGIEPAHTTQDLLDEPDRLDVEVVRRAATQVGDSLSVLSGPYRTIAPSRPKRHGVLRLLDCARMLGGPVVLDLSDPCDELFFDALAEARRVVLVAEQTVASLQSLRVLLDTLEERGCPAERLVALNRYDPRLAGFSLKRVQQVVGPVPVVPVANDYAAVISAQNNGRLLRLEAPRSRALADIRSLARKADGRPIQARAPRRAAGLPARLVRAVGLF